MLIEIDGEGTEIDNELWTFIKSVCLLTNKSPLLLIVDLLQEYKEQVIKQMNVPRTH